MSEAGANEGVGQRPGYRPQHEAASRPVPELDIGLLATIAAAVQVYLLQDREGVRRAPPAEEYHGRHRAEDRLQEAAAPPDSVQPEPATAPEPLTDENVASLQEPAPIFDQLQMELEAAAKVQAAAAETVPRPSPSRPRWHTYQVTRGARLAHAITEQNLPPEPQPAVETSQEEAAVEPPVAQEPERRRGLLEHLRHAWYAGTAAVTAYFAHPEKGRRRRALAGTAAVLGGVATIGLLAWLDGRTPQWHDNPNPGWPPPAAQPAGAPPNTEQFYDALTPHGYRGEPYEWTAAANVHGAPLATPYLQQLIDSARDSGLQVETWGEPDCGTWGITSVTASLPDGTEKTYYDTPRKLALLQWYAGGMGPETDYTSFS